MTRVHVILDPPRRVDEFLAFAKAVAACLSTDPLFAPPAAALSALENATAALETAVVTVLTRRFGAALERKARQRDVHVALQVLRAYVQQLADRAPADEAEMIAERAGMSVKDARGPHRTALVVKDGRVSGSAHAYLPAAKTRASYEWQIARDGADWVSLPVTTRADAVLEALVPVTKMWVRARTVSAAGPSDWQGPVSFIVK